MKKLLFIFCICSWLCCGHFLFAQKVEWVKKIIGNVSLHNIAQLYITPNGTVGFAEHYGTDTSITIDGKELSPITINTGEFYFVIASSNGEIKQIIRPLGRDNRRIRTLTGDRFGDFYIAGGCPGIAIFDSVVLDKNSMYLIKYDDNGKLKESYKSQIRGEYSTSIIVALNISKLDNSKYISGGYSGNLILNMKDTLLNSGNFFIKLDEKDNLKWLKKMTGVISNQPFSPSDNSIASDESGVLFAGFMRENKTYTFDTLTYKARNGDIQLQRMDNDGHIMWSGVLGGEKEEELNEVKINNGVAYVSGYTNGNMSFNGFNFKDLKGGFILALKFSTGEPLWIKNDSVNSIAFTKNGQIVTVRNFRDTLRTNNRTYIPKTFRDTSIQLYTDDLYFSILDSKTGETIYGWQMGGHGNEYAPIIATDSLDNIYLLCHANGETELGDSIFNINWGSFLAKISLPELGVKENNNTLQASIYPNPTSSDKINLKIILKKNGFVNLSITDINGKKMQEDILKLYLTGENELKINTNNYPNGKYFSTLQHDGITETISFVIQK